jgi:hypothetical protein
MVSMMVVVSMVANLVSKYSLSFGSDDDDEEEVEEEDDDVVTMVKSLVMSFSPPLFNNE